jgi:CTP:molybdopterin cytidylyltransferase MocA
MTLKTGIAILAAGASRRLGQPKQLCSVSGEPLLRRVAKVAAAAGCDGVGVVLGYAAEAVTTALHGLACEPLQNPAWSEGIASSIRVAADWAEARDFDALMLLVCDQVRLNDACVQQLWAAWLTHPDLPAGSAYAEVLGIPAVFPRARYAQLRALRGDRGAAQLLRRGTVTQVPWPDGAFDLDTPQDLARLRA